MYQSCTCPTRESIAPARNELFNELDKKFDDEFENDFEDDFQDDFVESKEGGAIEDVSDEDD